LENEANYKFKNSGECFPLQGLASDVVANTRKEKLSSKIEREIELKSPHTNSTFGFCQHTKYQREKTKRAIFCQHLKERK